MLVLSRPEILLCWMAVGLIESDRGLVCSELVLDRRWASTEELQVLFSSW